MNAICLLVPLLQGVGGFNPTVESTDPVVLIENYAADQTAACAGVVGEDACQETLMGIYYGSGHGPVFLGHPTEPRPAFVVLRGGNTNPNTPGKKPWFDSLGILEQGFVGVDPNFAIVDAAPGGTQIQDPCDGPVVPGLLVGDCGGPTGPPEDYLVAVRDVARVVQFLRANARELNVDPDQIFVFGRSFGAVVAYAVGLREDYQDPSSPDVVQHFSSRPNYILPFSGPTAMDCFGAFTVYGDWMKAYFPDSTAFQATLQEKWADSPWYWLLHPELYGRTETPPMFLGYNVSFATPCGSVTDPHDGTFGFVMWTKMDEFVGQMQDAEFGLDSKFLNTGDFFGFNQLTANAILDWADERMNPVAHEEMYLYPKGGPVGSAGTRLELELVGADPLGLAFVFLGTQPGAVPIPWCGFQGEIGDFLLLGAVPIAADGSGTLSLDVPASLVAPAKLLVQAVDFSGCILSNSRELFF